MLGKRRIGGDMSGSKEEVGRKEWQIEVIDELYVNAVDRMSPSNLTNP